MEDELGLDSGANDLIVVSGVVLETHGPGWCEGQICCIHNPTDHPMRHFPQLWRGDASFMERLCPHGIGHPDPNDYKVRNVPGYDSHGCDGCCSWKK